MQRLVGVAVVVYRMNWPKRTQSVKYEEILRRILEDSNDSDDDSNLSDDFHEIKN